MTSDEHPGPDEAAQPGPTEPVEAVGPVPALPSRVERIREATIRARSRVEARRADSGSLDAAFEAVERDTESGGRVLAAAVAFRVFMFLVPYAFVAVTGLGLASSAVHKTPQDAARSLGIGGLLAQAVGSTSSMSTVNRITALVVGGVALAFTSRSLVKVLWIVHRLIWGVRASTKPPARAVPLLVGIATALFLISGLISWMGSQSLGARLLAALLTMLLAAATWFLVSQWLPHGDCDWTGFLPGAAVVGIGVGLLHLATVTYIAYEVSKKSSTYGTIGVAVGLLLWTYMLGRLLTASIAANAAIWGHRMATARAIRDAAAGAESPGQA